MICVIRKGTGFRGVAEYLLQNGRGCVIGGSMAGNSPRELAREAGLIRKLRPTLGRAVTHFSLSAAPEDPHLSDQAWNQIAVQFLCDLGYEGCAHVIVRHDDTGHQHVHLACLRIDAEGKTIPDSKDRYKAERSLARIEAQFGLRRVNAISPARSRAGPRSKPQQNTNNPGEETTVQNEKQESDVAKVQDASPEERPEDEAQAAMAGTGWAGDNPSERHRRNMRRLTKAKEYESSVWRLLDPDVTYVHQHPRGASIYLRKPERIADEGDRLTAYRMDHERAARSIVALAAARGWTSIVFAGSPAFVGAAMRQAVQAGIPVRPTDGAQRLILEQILAEQGGATGVVEAPLAFQPVTDPSDDLMPVVDDDEEPRPLKMAERLARRRQREGNEPQRSPRLGK